MDFLTLFCIYVVVVLTCIALVCKYSGQQHTPFERLYTTVTELISVPVVYLLDEVDQGASSTSTMVQFPGNTWTVTLINVCNLLWTRANAKGDLGDHKSFLHGFHNTFKTFATGLYTDCFTRDLLCGIEFEKMQFKIHAVIDKYLPLYENSFFIYLHLLLEAAVYGEFSYEVFGFCLEMDTSLFNVCVPYVLLVIKSCFFYLCCKSDPGTLTKQNHRTMLEVYQYDEKLFQEGIMCPTCELMKPARSKHCRLCNRCVHRFDHHCVWVNNCIGAQNTRYFLLYLLSVCAMAGDMAVLTADMLFHAVLRSGLMHSHYTDAQGHQLPAGPAFVIQQLFMTFPRIVFMLGFLIFVFFLLAGYSMFHCYLALVNQTSNEWFKLKGHRCQDCHPFSRTSCPTAYNPLRGFYNRGLLKNVGEVFWPLSPIQKKDD